METVVTPSGRLKNQFLPAIYFDSSVLIDYWMTEGMDLPNEITEDQRDWAEISHGPLAKIVQDLLRSDARLNKVAEIRKKAMYESIRAIPVTSHAALWELQEWIAESGFKQVGAQVSGMIFLQRKSKKEIGDYLKKGFELWVAEGDEKHHDPRTGTSGLELLMQATWINLSFAQAHGLQGVIIAETANFNWPPKQGDGEDPFVDPYMLAFLQLGLADIMHVLMANHLGCRYFASFDSDFRRAKGFIEESGMSVLANPEEVLSIL
jgi:hypothetical protein